MLQLPEDYDTIVDEQEQKCIMDRIESSNKLQTYQYLAQSTTSILKAVEQVRRDQTRVETMAFADNTWDGDTVLFRQRLILIARYVTPFFSLVPPMPLPSSFRCLTSTSDWT
jgi:hypothetical protein